MLRLSALRHPKSFDHVQNILLPSGASLFKAEKKEFRVLPHPEGESMLE